MSREKYSQEISRENPGCILFLLDQSYSMEEPLGNSSRRKMDVLATAINSWLQNMIIRAGTGGTVKDWFDIGVLGYRTDEQAEPMIKSALQGPLADKILVPISEIAENIARIDKVTKRVPDEDTGEILEMSVDMQVWVDPKAEGGTPMCGVLYQAFEILEEWIEQHPKSFPPIVVHITDGESQDGDPIPYAESLRELETEDGNVLLFNCHLSMSAADSFMFPASDEILPDELAKVLFQMSSVLPDRIVAQAKNEGIELQPQARGMAFNADMVVLIQFLDMGTRVALR